MLTLCIHSYDELLGLEQCTALAATLVRRPDLREIYHTLKIYGRVNKEEKFFFSKMRTGAERAKNFEENQMTLKSSQEYHLANQMEWFSPVIGGPFEIRLCVSLLLLTPQLRILHMPGRLMGVFNGVTRHDGLRSVKTVELYGEEFPEGDVETTIDSLVDLPSLSELSFYRCDPYFDYHERPFNLSIKSLELLDGDIMIGDLTRLVESTEGLEAFRFRWLARERAESMMVSHGVLHSLRPQKSTLKQLRLNLAIFDDNALLNSVYFNHFAEATELASFTAIEDLDIEYLAFLEDEKMNWADIHLPERLSVSLSMVLPPSVKNLTLRNCLGRVRRHLSQLLHRSNHPAIVNKTLHRIHIEMGPEFTEESWTVLEDEFARRGIVLTVTAREPPVWETVTIREMARCPHEDDYITEAEWRC